MTLRATIEIIPFGDESKARKLLTLNVSNITHKDGRGREGQDVYVIERDQYKQYDDTTPRVHHRRDAGFEALVIKALEVVK